MSKEEVRLSSSTATIRVREMVSATNQASIGRACVLATERTTNESYQEPSRSHNRYTTTFREDLLVPSVALMKANEMPFALTVFQLTFGWNPETSIP